jgi:toxin ParE1/3/4
MTLRFTPRARDDLREIMDYIAKDNPVGADQVGRAILNACAHYFVEGADVWVVHIRHSARRPMDEQT